MTKTKITATDALTVLDVLESNATEWAEKYLGAAHVVKEFVAHVRTATNYGRTAVVNESEGTVGVV